MKTKLSTRKPRILSVRIERKVDESPDLSYFGEYSSETPSDHALDRAELGDQERGQHRYFEPSQHTSVSYMCGIIAKAEVVSTAGITQVLRSGGLWGVESDSSAEYLASVENEQLTELRAELESFGFSKRMIDHAFARVERGE